MPDTPRRDASDLSRVDPARLGSVWPGLGLPTAGLWRPEELGDVLRHQLSAPLETAGTGGDEPGRPTHGELLFREEDPPAAALRRVKDWAKPFMSCDDGDVPPEVAGVLYFAAILAARVRLGLRISELPDARLGEGARWALGLVWLDAAAVPLFRAALAAFESDPDGPGMVPSNPPAAH